MRELALPRAGNVAGWFTGISRDGSTSIAVAGPGTGGSVFDAYTWSESGGWRLLPLPSSIAVADDVGAQGVNRDGSLVVGGVNPAGSGSEAAVLWTNGVPSVLNALGANWDMGATAVSDDGSVIVGAGQDRPNSFFSVATIWRNGEPIVLRDYLTSLGVSIPSSVSLEYCTGVSADGLTISGVARPFGGTVRQGFVATVPSPTAGGVGVIVVFVAARRRRR